MDLKKQIIDVECRFSDNAEIQQILLQSFQAYLRRILAEQDDITV